MSIATASMLVALFQVLLVHLKSKLNGNAAITKHNKQ
jgi:hypothetical protein